MRNMKGAMALEYIFTIIILIVTAAVIIMLMFTFSKDAQRMFSDFICSILQCQPEEKVIFPQEPIQKESFTSKEVTTYIENCLSVNEAIKEGEQKDVVCWILISDTGKPFSSFSINKESILSSLSSNIKDRVEIKSDFSKPILKIKFEDLGNRIVVE